MPRLFDAARDLIRSDATIEIIPNLESISSDLMNILIMAQGH